jgi:hypothetical protein
MSRRSAIRGVLHNFLGTFTSRYSEFQGHWLFGFLVEDLDNLQIDLLEWPKASDPTPTNVARGLAVQRFRVQMNNNALPIAWVREACLDISKVSERRIVVAGGGTRPIYDVRFDARVVTDLGRTYTSTASIAAWRHDLSKVFQ